MAIIICPECDGNVSDKALACPHCGFPVLENRQIIPTSPDLTTEHQQQGLTSTIKQLYKPFREGFRGESTIRWINKSGHGLIDTRKTISNNIAMEFIDRHKINWQMGQWETIKSELDICDNELYAYENIIDGMHFLKMQIVARVEVTGRFYLLGSKEYWSKMRIVDAWRWTEEDSLSLAVYATGLLLREINIHSMYKEVFENMFKVITSYLDEIRFNDGKLRASLDDLNKFKMNHDTHVRIARESLLWLAKVAMIFKNHPRRLTSKNEDFVRKTRENGESLDKGALYAVERAAAWSPDGYNGDTGKRIREDSQAWIMRRISGKKSLAQRADLVLPRQLPTREAQNAG